MPLPNISGSMTLHGITDAELVKILEVKIRHEGSFTFTPQQLQPAMFGTQPGYNNVQIGWVNLNGFKAAHEVVTLLLNREEKAKASGQ